MAEKKYNPYYAANSIYNAKAAYNKAKTSGGDYNVPAETAKQYYQELRDNGYGALADNLANSTEEQAADIMKSYAPDVDTNSVNSTVNQLISTPPSTGINTQQYIADSENMLKSIQNYMEPSEQQTQAQRQTQAGLQEQLNAFNSNNAQISGMNVGAQNMINDAYTNTNAQVGDIYKYLYANPYESDVGKSIMSKYNELGAQAAGNATADAASTNSGNIDSYSAANANRQKISYLNAGNSAVVDQYNSTATNLLGTLQQYGVNVSDLLGQYNTLIGNNQQYNNNILDSYNAAGAENNAVLENQRATNVQAQDNANKYLADLYGKSSDNALNEYLGRLSAASTAQGTMVGADTEVMLQQLMNILGIHESDNQLEGVKVQDAGNTTRTGMTTTSNEKITGMETQSKENVANTNANATVEAAKTKQGDGENVAKDEGTTEELDFMYKQLISGDWDNRVYSPYEAFAYMEYTFPGSKSMIDAMRKTYEKSGTGTTSTPEVEIKKKN